ncbi:MAG: phosphoglycolate phosphatase [Planctomycetes bacterium SCN 63-9]|mgnify:CR=1 FL=1|nr:MAG: phosphoglycolate phosphatase [Planctomycetes bacterium SCN 63-9]
MRFLALATDYDGTLAHDGKVDEPTISAIERLRDSGRKLILVTGRELDELIAVFPRIDLFDRVVAENGALLYRPEDRSEGILGERPPESFLDSLRGRGVERISVGRVIVATWEPYQSAVLEAIREAGLELQVIFNKGAVMILPSGVNKATGLNAALQELGLSPHNVVSVGDAENDHAFLAISECSVAVSNALDALKERADHLTLADHGAGVAELIDGLVADDLCSVMSGVDRHDILLGRRADLSEARLTPYGSNVLVTGTSGSGKSTLTTGLLERLAESGYQYAIIDPEGDYESLEGAVVIGTPRRVPTVKEVLDLLQNPTQNVVVNLLGIALGHRPAFFEEFLPQIQELRSRTGRPHWIVVDETHHLLPITWDPAALTLPLKLRNMIYITVHPDSVAREIADSVDLVFAVGDAPEKTIMNFCEAVGEESPSIAPTTLASGEALIWNRRDGSSPERVRSEPPKSEHSRHSRKYAEGNLGPDRSFRFRGPEGKLNLRAQNLVVFLQIAEGVDDATWLFHLGQADYSRWFREGIKDESLGAEAEKIESQPNLSPEESRVAIREAIESRYTLPSEAASGHAE